MPPNGISSSDYARVCLYGLLSTHRLHLTLFPFSEPSLRPCRVASPIRASTRIQNFSTGLSFPCRSGPSLSRGPLPACTVRNFGPPGAGTGFESTDAKLCDFEKRSPVASPRSRLHFKPLCGKLQSGFFIGKTGIPMNLKGKRSPAGHIRGQILVR